MNNPADPLDNQNAITQLNEALNYIVREIIIPTTKQAKANQEALAGLVEMVADGAVERAEQNSRIENLIAESREDRRKADERWAEMQRESQERFEAMQRKADEDRAEYARRFDDQLTEIRAIGEQNRALLSALAATNRRVDDLDQAS